MLSISLGNRFALSIKSLFKDSGPVFMISWRRVGDDV